MPTKIDVQDVKDRLLDGATPRQLSDWYSDKMGIDVTRQAISLHRQKLVKEGKLEQGKPGRPKGSQVKQETRAHKTTIDPKDLAEALMSITKKADRAQRLESENLALRGQIDRRKKTISQYRIAYEFLLDSLARYLDEDNLLHIRKITQPDEHTRFLNTQLALEALTNGSPFEEIKESVVRGDV